MRAATILLGCLLFSACGSSPEVRYTSGGAAESDPEYPRDGFGNSKLPLWSPLGPFEERALGGLDAARQGDWKALLDLALFSSGRPLTIAEADALQARVAQFVERVRPEVTAETDLWQQGFRLHTAMHREFLGGAAKPAKGGEGQEILSQYDEEQSTVLGILETGKYNCISSAMLYLVLARAFNFEVRGVLLETHAFAQVNLPAGKRIEVETTSDTGFDWVHDASFYTKDAAVWAANRRIRPATLADYQKRKVLSPVDLFTGNLRNQHTLPGVMHPRDRKRLLEAWSVFQPDDAEAWKSRLWFYADEQKHFEEAKDAVHLLQMFEHVSPAIEEAATRFAADPDVVDLVGWMQLYHARALVAAGRLDEGLAQDERVMATAGRGAKQADKLMNNALVIVNDRVNELVEAKKFEDALAVMDRFDAACGRVEWCVENRSWFWSKWGNHYWQQDDWQNAVTKNLKAVEVSVKPEHVESARQSVEGAFLNWSLVFERQGNWPKTAEVLQDCVARSPQSTECASRLAELQSKHQM